MTTKTAGQIQELGGHIEEFAGKETAQKVMIGSEKIAKSSDKVKVALWVKETIDCLDAAATAETCDRIMTACGYNCLARATGLANGIKNRRKKHSTEEAFLEAEIKKPLKGIRLELKGKTLIHYYTPHTYSAPRRCFCGLMNALPEGTNASLTYCNCSRAFVEKYWEGALGRPVKVEVVQTCLGGAEKCKFIIHL
jgi:hypothetical protein